MPRYKITLRLDGIRADRTLKFTVDATGASEAETLLRRRLFEAEVVDIARVEHDGNETDESKWVRQF